MKVHKVTSPARAGKNSPKEVETPPSAPPPTSVWGKRGAHRRRLRNWRVLLRRGLLLPMLARCTPPSRWSPQHLTRFNPADHVAAIARPLPRPSLYDGKAICLSSRSLRGAGPCAPRPENQCGDYFACRSASAGKMVFACSGAETAQWLNPVRFGTWASSEGGVVPPGWRWLNWRQRRVATIVHQEPEK